MVLVSISFLLSIKSLPRAEWIYYVGTQDAH
jgi:hypothetical protein